MATVNERRAASWAETGWRVRHPLEAVRKYIRTYVSLEGLGIAVLYLAGVFWIGVALDWGTFKLFAFDWVQELQYLTAGQGSDFWLRLVLVGTVGLGLVVLVATKIFLRQMREFSDQAVALLLERRFPHELGDRLITAVELADPSLAEKYGYSAALVEKTIDEAAERVEKLPVADVFNWARLRRIFLQCGLATVGMYILVGIGTCALGAATGGSTSPIDFMWRFNDVATIFVERNVLLMDTYWPRQAYLEVIGFQDTAEHRNEMKVGRDEQRPDLQVRGVRWVVADHHVQGGWRPLRWSDLGALLEPADVAEVKIAADWSGWIIDLDDLEVPVAAGVLPASWQGKTSGDIRNALNEPALKKRLQDAGLTQAVENLLDWHTWTLDRLDLQLKKPGVSAQLRQDHVNAMFALEKKIFPQLSDLAQSPSMSRRLRELEIPAEVTVYYRGKTIKNDQTQELAGDNKYTIGLNDLKESVRFTVRGRDYYTPYKDITLVPPPGITSLVVDKEEPAYVHHRLKGDQKPLRGKKQIFRNHPVSVTGEASIIQVPLGTSLVLIAEVEKDRPLKPGVRVVVPEKFSETGAIVPDNLVRLEAPHRFSLKIDKIVKTHEFLLDFHDQDNVKGRRRVLIRPIDDRPPELFDVEMEAVLRKPRFKQDPGKSGQGTPIDAYLITPDAAIPIKGTVQDDYGLTMVEWVFEADQVEIELMGEAPVTKAKTGGVLRGNARTRRSGLLTSGLQMTPGLTGLEIYGPAYWSWVSRMMQIDLALKRAEGERTAPLKTFLERREERAGEEIPLAALEAKLKQPPEHREAFRKISWKDSDGFEMRKHLPELKSKDPQNEAQLHYHLRLSLSATDNNVETGPSSSRNKIPFQFLVVSENELLAQIGLEEEVLSERLEKVYEKLKNAKTIISDQLAKLGQDEPKYEAIGIRVDEVRKALMDGATTTREVHADYSRIERELEVNQLHDKKKRVFGEIVFPLQSILDPKEGDFPQTEEVVQKLHEGLEEDAVEAAKGKSALANRNARLDGARLARDKVDILMTKVNDILVVMQKEVTFAKALERALYLERIQRQTAERLRRLYEDEERRLFESLFKK